MNIEATKLELMQLLLQTEKESLLNKLKKVFEEEYEDRDKCFIREEGHGISIAHKKELTAMSLEELNLRIDKSENDFKNDRFTSSETILSKYL